MSMFAVTLATVRRMVRDRTALFFVLIMPIAIILIIGVTVGGFNKFRVGVVLPPSPGPIATTLSTELARAPALATRRYADVAGGRTALRRGEVTAVVVVPPDLDALARSGRPAAVTVLVEQQIPSGRAAASAVQAVVAEHAGLLQAAGFTVSTVGGSLDSRLALATGVQRGTAPISVRAETVNGTANVLPAGFGYSTPTMLVLFVFINALASGAVIIQTRSLGIYARALASPIGAARIVLGETAAYLALTLIQSVIIIGIGSLIFGVTWGDPLAATALVTVWALVGTGFGVLAGTIFRTPEQASSVGPTVGILFGMLGGCMWPLSIVPDFMRVAGHFTPHAWAIDAWTTLLSRNGGIADIGRDLLILLTVASAALALATVRLRRRLVA